MVDGRSLRYAGRREELLDGATDWVLANGLRSLSLRGIAADLGISHRTLLHHFPTKQQLVAEVLRELRARNVAILKEHAASSEEADPRSLIVAMWEHFAAPENLAYHRLFFEVYGLSLTDPDRYSAYRDGFESDWAGAIVELLAAAGASRARAGQLATLIVASYRGLLLDLLITGDRERTGAALEQLAAYIGSTIPPRE
jgi:AcrR family transcriptional regulator